MKNISKKVILFLSFFFILLSTVFAQGVWEADVVRSINPQNPDSKVWRGVSHSTKFISAATPVTMLAVGLINHNKDLKEKSLETFGSLAITLATSQVIKYAVNRRRPYQKYSEIYPDEIRDGKSFPSGHASVAFSTAASLSLEYKKWYVVAPAFAWASAVAYSRLYLGQHYPSDLAAAAVVGAGSAWLSHKATKWLTKKK